MSHSFALIIPLSSQINAKKNLSLERRRPGPKPSFCPCVYNMASLPEVPEQFQKTATFSYFPLFSCRLLIMLFFYDFLEMIKRRKICPLNSILKTPRLASAGLFTCRNARLVGNVLGTKSGQDSKITSP